VTIRVRFFAALRERMGPARTETVAAGTTAGALWRTMVAECPELGRFRVRIAVNEEYVPSSHRLTENDEVAFFPPVSGG
jgi:molybdopterin synthase sulfur carrier subunit